MAEPQRAPLTVLHLVKTAAGGEWALNQMQHLVRMGLEIHVATPDDGRHFQTYLNSGITVHKLETDFPVRRPWQLPTRLSALRTLVSEISPDLIHSHFVGTTLMMRLALGREHPVKRLFQVPGPLHLEHALYRTLEISLAGPPDYWIGTCAWTCERYRKCGIAPERVFLAYYGKEIAPFVYNERRGRLRERLGVSTSVPLVGMVAYMYAPKYYLGQTRGLKGHEDLLDALALCHEKRPDILGVFMGGAARNSARYEQAVRAYGERRCGKRAIFLGTVDDVAEYYADLDVTVHPSHSENLGGAAESMLQGVPTIATDVGGFPDLVRPGETGWLVPPKAPEALAAAILEALDNWSAARRLGLCGQKRARELLDVRQTTRDVLKIYHALVRRTASADKQPGALVASTVLSTR